MNTEILPSIYVYDSDVLYIVLTHKLKVKENFFDCVPKNKNNRFRV